MSISWNDYFMSLAVMAASKSKDPSTQTGCVIVSKDHSVLATGFNGFPRGIEREEVTREEKLELTEHAERNAIFCAARQGTALKGATVYCTFFPCMECMRAMIQSGIDQIFYAEEISYIMKGTGRWESCISALKLGQEAGIEVTPLRVSHLFLPSILINQTPLGVHLAKTQEANG